MFEYIVDPTVTVFHPDLFVVSASQDSGTVGSLGKNIVTKDDFT